MSWKGFVKAVARLPHQVKSRSGHADGTIDDEYDALAASFDGLFDSAARLAEDATKYKKSVEDMLTHQASFASTLLDVYSPIAGRSSTSPTPTLQRPGESGGGGSVSPTATLRKSFTAPESMEAVQTYLRNLESVREPINQELSVIDRRIVAPLADILEIFKAIRKTMVKRNHKLVDYDRFRTDASKLRSATASLEPKDQRRLIETERSLQQSMVEFAMLNDALKLELPRFLDLRIKFIDPCFLSLFLLQRRIYAQLAAVIDPLRAFPELKFLPAREVSNRFAARHAEAENAINQLSILKFTPAQLAAATAGMSLAGPTASSPLPPTGPAPGYSTLPVQSTGGSGGGIPSYKQSPPSGVPTGYGGGVPTAMGGGAAMYGGAQPASMPTPTPFGVPTGASARGPPPPVVPRASPAGPPVVKVVTAIYDFDAQQPDDLPFKAGDRIDVLEATGSTNDWWKGRCHGRIGSFPANYTQ
ncbi:hypothetical protein BC828DRAFT_374290 [Blastocladiella britannica]|nr:hypothetical protein BC828DRAFT_374290 [Blastocladiella britannica]